MTELEEAKNKLFLIKEEIKVLEDAEDWKSSPFATAIKELPVAMVVLSVLLGLCILSIIGFISII